MLGQASLALQFRCARQLFLVFFGMLRGMRDGSIRAASKRTILSRRLFWIARFAVVAYAVISGSVEAWAERRVALVMGNASYSVPTLSLSNPRNDAEDISAVLKQLDFKVVTAINSTRRDMELKLEEFARLAADTDSALFFYAGHAMQYQGSNYLMPTDAKLEDEFSIRYEMVGLEEVNAALDRVNGVKILILDACRNNPLADRLQRTIGGAPRSVAMTRGLARIDKTQGMVIAYATTSDAVADDGKGRNSPFTGALLKWLKEPGLEIATLLRRVTADVNTQTGGRQRPETTISLLSDYYLNQNDRIAWDHINLDDVAALRDFLDKYPSSSVAILARNRLDVLERLAREREEAKQREAEQKRQEELKRIAEEQKRLAEEQRRQDEQKRLAEEQKRQDEQKRLAEEQKRQDEQKRLAEEQRRQDEQKRLAEEQNGQDAHKRLAALEGYAPETKGPTAGTTPPGLTTSPQPIKANLPEQIRRAQTELKRLGCLDGKMDTDKAIKAFLKYSHKPVVEINITDDFIAELQRQPNDICPPPRKKSPMVAKRATPNKDAAAPPRELTPVEGPQPLAVPQRAQGAALGTGF
jgi:uncharacterized caspase-like protein